MSSVHIDGVCAGSPRNDGGAPTAAGGAATATATAATAAAAEGHQARPLTRDRQQEPVRAEGPQGGDPGGARRHRGGERRRHDRGPGQARGQCDLLTGG